LSSPYCTYWSTATASKTLSRNIITFLHNIPRKNILEIQLAIFVYQVASFILLFKEILAQDFSPAV
jgi:hypothetical protein